MTYNFDPDRWYDDEYAAIEYQYSQGKVTRDERTRALADLEKRYEDMVKRLDGTFQVRS